MSGVREAGEVTRTAVDGAELVRGLQVREALVWMRLRGWYTTLTYDTVRFSFKTKQIDPSRLYYSILGLLDPVLFFIIEKKNHIYSTLYLLTFVKYYFDHSPYNISYTLVTQLTFSL